MARERGRRGFAVCVLQSRAMGDERRQALDGWLYTATEFREYYKDNWEAKWKSAKPGAPQPVVSSWGVPQEAGAGSVYGEEMLDDDWKESDVALVFSENAGEAAAEAESWVNVWKSGPGLGSASAMPAPQVEPTSQPAPPVEPASLAPCKVVPPVEPVSVAPCKVVPPVAPARKDLQDGASSASSTGSAREGVAADAAFPCKPPPGLSSDSQLLNKQNTSGAAAAVRTGGAVQPAGGVVAGPYLPRAVIDSLNIISERSLPEWERVDACGIWSGARFFHETLPRKMDGFRRRCPEAKRAQRLREALDMAAETYYEFLPLLVSTFSSFDVAEKLKEKGSVVVAEVVARIPDNNRRPRYRVDFFCYHPDGHVVRHHPGNKQDAKVQVLAKNCSFFRVERARDIGVGAALYAEPPGHLRLQVSVGAGA